MAPKCSWEHRLLGALCEGFFGGLSVQDRDMYTIPQLVLPVDYDLLVGRKTGVNERLTLTDLSNLDWAGSHRAVGCDNVRVSSLLALLHDRCGNGQAIMPRIEE